jgi:cellobiose phosphorylase
MRFSRRDIIKRGSMLCLAAAGMPFPSAARAAAERVTPVGAWWTGRHGLPGFRYLGRLPYAATDKEGRDAQLPDDPMFILGNYRLTVFAHASGVLQIMSGERAWARANAAPARINYGEHGARLRVTRGAQSTATELVGTASLAADPAHCERLFGAGFARYDYQLGDGLRCRRVVSVRPSAAVNQGNPTIIVTVTLDNHGKAPVDYDYLEQVGNAWVTADTQRTDPRRRRVVYETRLAADPAQGLLLSANRARLAQLAVEDGARDSSANDLLPMHLFLQARAGAGGARTKAISPDPAHLAGQASGTLAPGARASFDIAVGLTFGGLAEASSQAGEMWDAAVRDGADEGLYLAEWARRLPDLSAERNALLRREMLWNAWCLEAMATYSAYFGETYVPQGQVYNYQDGENISNRDHAQALLPLVYTNPALARSSIRYLFKHTTRTGEIRRGTIGVGYSAPGMFKESDEQLYAFLALGEYLRVTRDYGLLDDVIAYYPVEDGRTDTVLTFLTRHFVYLRDEVGLGEHGLVRILNSDWSDAFFFGPISPNAVQHSAESHMNSAMALAVLPVLCAGLKAAHSPQAATLALAMEAYAEALRRAFLRDLGERDFAARAYMGEGRPDFGLDAVCIEAQGFLLQMSGLPAQRKRRIYARVKPALLEPVGFRIHERPIFGGKAEGEDGAVWAALEHQLIKGVLSFDREEGERLLERTSFAVRAATYPNYWLGQWTRFDGMQSSVSGREGLFNYWYPEIFRVAFTGFCSHAHSWPLYNYMLLRRA